MNTSPLIKVCERHILPKRLHPVVPEPYVPFVPKQWNGILFLAEAQNLSKTRENYRSELLALPREGRILRLYQNGSDNIGIQPWDDGSLKLAALAMFPKEHIENFAISNAVPWSIVRHNDSNKNPTDTVEKYAAQFWGEILPLLKPKKIICAGNVAARVIGVIAKILPLRLPSPYFTNGLANLFDKEDLLSRYPEVFRALARLPEGNSVKENPGKILYACHAVSRIKSYL